MYCKYNCNYIYWNLNQFSSTFNRCSAIHPARKSRRIVRHPMLLTFHKTSCTATTLDPIIRLQQVSVLYYILHKCLTMDASYCNGATGTVRYRKGIILHVYVSPYWILVQNTYAVDFYWILSYTHHCNQWYSRILNTLVEYLFWILILNTYVVEFYRMLS